MNPLMLKPDKRTRVIQANRGVVAEDCLPYEDFVGRRVSQTIVQSHQEEALAWRAKYGFEEIMDSLDEEAIEEESAP
jgi:hypothetical protein